MAFIQPRLLEKRRSGRPKREATVCQPVVGPVLQYPRKRAGWLDRIQPGTASRTLIYVDNRVCKDGKVGRRKGPMFHDLRLKRPDSLGVGGQPHGAPFA